MRELLRSTDIKVPFAAIHFAAWVAYAGYIYIANYVARPSIQFLNVVISLVPYCITFYVVLYFLKCFGNRKLSWVVVGFVLLFVAMSTLAWLFVYRLLPLFGLHLYGSGNFGDFLQAALLGYVQFHGYALLYFYADRMIKKGRELRHALEDKLQAERQKMEQVLENSRLKTTELRVLKEKAEFEYAYLQSQISPHFLFNTLNVLIYQATKFSSGLAENIAKLADIMRYSIQSVEGKTTAVMVQKELDNLQILIEINQLRFGDSYYINFTIDGDSSGHIVPPLSMISIVENALKYGELNDPENPLSIRVVMTPGLLSFVCRNKKRPLSNVRPSHNIGLRNLHDRLRVAFKDRYKTSITDEQGFYTFQLIIESV